MLMPSARVSVANTTLHQARAEQLLDDLLEHRQQAGVVGGDAALEAVEPVVEAEHGEVLVGDARAALLERPPRISSRSSGVGEAHARRAGSCCTAASQPARLKMKVIAGSRSLALEPRRSTSTPAGRALGGAAAAPAASAAAGRRAAASSAPRRARRGPARG